MEQTGENRKIPLVILTGPTAVGKTALSLELAEKIGGEIISADSMQVYRGMDIGSAKITKAEMGGIPHHLIDILDPRDAFDVTRFQHLAAEAVKQIHGRGHIPILTGGTGFYIQSVLYDIHFEAVNEDAVSEHIRQKYEELALEAEGPAKLYARLQIIDPEAASQIHPNNVKRVIRALAFYEETGERISLHNEREKNRPSPYNYIYFVLNDDRAKIYERIDRRVDQMISAGLVREVQALKDAGCTRDMVSMQGLGYKEILDYLDGRQSLEEAVYLIKRDTRHFAKRQLTWFRRERDVSWVDRSVFASEADILDYMLECMRQRGMIASDR